MNCLLRVIKRQNHETITGDETERALTVLNFITSYGGQSNFFGVQRKENSDVDAVIAVDYCNNEFGDDIPWNLKTDLIGILRSAPNAFGLTKSDEISSFVDDFTSFYEDYEETKGVNVELFGYDYTKLWEKVIVEINKYF